jgi:hypothetical protein
MRILTVLANILEMRSKISRASLKWLQWLIICTEFYFKSYVSSFFFNFQNVTVAKPLVAKSHELSLAYDPTSLTKLEPPLVLQEFVNHGIHSLSLVISFF